MSKDVLTLRDLPGPFVELACSKCPTRNGSLRLDKLKERFGADYRLPDMLADLANCPPRGKFHNGCGAYYPQLKPAE
ncbi:MAG TPA: hypothetical protein VGH62_01515 [Bradyrhizobium sp.]|jgi:hypothetical protein